MGGENFYGAGRASTILYDTIENALRPIAPEIDFYRSFAPSGTAPVLEIGCGTGRISWALAAAGHPVVGVDAAAAMLELARRKSGGYPEAVTRSVSFILGDACALDLGRRFDLVLSPYVVINHILSLDGQRAFLATVRRHLAEGGRAILDTIHPGLDELSALPKIDAVRSRQAQPILVAHVTGHHAKVERRTAITRIDSFNQIFEFAAHISVEDGEKGSLSECIDLLSYRWITPSEMYLLLELEGLRLVAEYQDFARTPPSGFGHRVWVVERR